MFVCTHYRPILCVLVCVLQRDTCCIKLWEILARFPVGVRSFLVDSKIILKGYRDFKFTAVSYQKEKEWTKRLLIPDQAYLEEIESGDQVWYFDRVRGCDRTAYVKSVVKKKGVLHDVITRRDDVHIAPNEIRRPCKYIKGF